MKTAGPLEEGDKRHLVFMLITRLRCAVCGRSYHPHDFTLVDRRQSVWVLGMRCRHCGASGHVIIAMHLDAESKPVTDLTAEEIEDVTQWPPITADDVLDTHQLLEQFDGDFEALFTH